jgi:hypothetical protein
MLKREFLADSSGTEFLLIFSKGRLKKILCPLGATKIPHQELSIVEEYFRFRLWASGCENTLGLFSMMLI